MRLIESSCNTGGINGKQGGYYYDWCANVTINPNPDDDCSGGKTETQMKISAPEIQFHGQYATNEQHEAAKAAAMGRESNHAKAEIDAGANLCAEPERPAPDVTPMGLEMVKRANARASANNSTITEVASGLEGRGFAEPGALLKCFDGGDYGTCWHLPREDLEEAVDWFCFVNQGYEIDMTDDNTEAQNLGVEGN